MPTSIPIPQLKWGKKKERSIMALVFTIDGRIRTLEIPVESNCANLEYPDGSGKGFLIDAENQYEGEDGLWYQLIDEQDQEPICLRKPHISIGEKEDEQKKKTASDEIFRRAFRQRLMEGMVRAKTTSSQDRMVLIVSIVFGSLLLFAGMNYLWG